jgi:glycosyltransferase involved in cell wall biosynthesis
VAGQTLPPIEWVIIDDGSSDGTWEILQEAASRHSWIHPVKRADRGFRHSGAGVVDAFYDGLEALNRTDWHFLVKLDGDLSFAADYFAGCLGRFEQDPKLGIGGGLICAAVNGAMVAESRFDPAFHVRGATKIYRRACWDAIGGLLRCPGWDGMDEIKANMLGWRTATFPEFKVRHFRPAGLAYGRWKDWVKGGRGNYIAGYHPLFMVAKSLRRFGIKPYGIASFGLLTGYFGSCLKREPRIADPRAVRYIRQQQINRLLGRKSIWSE